MDVRQKEVLVAGSGISGIAAARLLKKAGAVPVLYDADTGIDKKALAARLEEAADCRIVLGALSRQETAQTELVVLSPGIPVDAPFVKEFMDRGIPVWGEVELGYRFSKGKVLAITGTNGKTTTTALAGKIMRDHQKDVFVVGNIGNPYTVEALKTTEDSVTVAEISSFQLETTDTFCPDVSAILNITPDHLNRHHTMENYAAIKKSITRRQTKDQICVLNYRDDMTREFAEECPAEPVFFSSLGRLENGYYLEDDIVCRAVEGRTEKLFSMRETKLLGLHNAENVMAAVAMTAAAGVPIEAVIASVKEFNAVEHRIEYVATRRGVEYYNDSKGTNPDAAIQGIRAMRRPTVLIGGGYDKESRYDDWIEAFDGKVKRLVLIGQTREKIADCARAHGFTAIEMADSLQEAMEICVRTAESGDAVLLSPACASWGMFPNYEARGNQFKEYVNQIEE